MTSEPEPPSRGVEYPSLENSPRPDPFAPVDYPPDAGLPPPVYPNPYAGYPGYPVYPYGSNPYDPYRPTKPPGTNGKAIDALITSLLGLPCCGLPSIAGVILGVMAMRETRRTGQDGYGIASAGAIIGGLVIAIWAFYLLVTFVISVSGFQYAP